MFSVQWNVSFVTVEECVHLCACIYNVVDGIYLMTNVPFHVFVAVLMMAFQS